MEETVRVSKRLGPALICAVLISACGKATPTSPTSTTSTTTTSSPVELVISGPSTGNIGQTIQLTANVRFSNGTTQNVTAQASWQASNGMVAQFASAGLLAVTGLGIVDIRATYQTVDASHSFTVLPVGNETPTYLPARALMPQVSTTGPLYVTAGPMVNGAALEAAGTMLRTMLQFRFDVAAALRSAGALTAVFGRDETSCDLPYFANLAGTASCTTGGLGGTMGTPVTACSERNLLSQSDDPYFRGRPSGENTCVHELAHTIMNVGLSNADRTRIHVRYEAAVTEGKWSGAFAMQNDNEFFAEMTQTYFCANPEIPVFNHPQGINCAVRLQAYDATTYALIHDIFRGSADLR